MKLSHFNFHLPEELIAQYPSEQRDEARLLVYHQKTGEIEHKIFKDLINYFAEKDVFVFNDTKVIPAKLIGTKDKNGAQIEVFLLRELNQENKLWDVLVEPARKIRIGNKLYFGENADIIAEVIDNTTSRGRTIRFLNDIDHGKFINTLYQIGGTPLPSILNRDASPEDTDRYQTIYAKKEGAVAAPTAGLHFSKSLLKKLEIIGVDFGYVTLHAGLGNFRDVDVEDLSKHKADSEQIIVTEQCANIVNKAKSENRNICAVGTTVLKTIESSVSINGHLKPYEGWTNKFLFPPYDIKIPTALISNFHLPKSTLMMAVAAFNSKDAILNLYNIAIKEKYKFGTYGDAMLCLNF
ncbi:MAG: tRNA preQ1(34) S-adenosylmethionine ribosyltransferase-isomerase QueA [Bacteroidales bacterium]|jgi:S-adenosylmethionine:tRNA ribosyltransferase-isomerase|nr:tRNA preQ1(34) S-adenosylmethionine ribosyltransferase-isomerase QueA [Bacteroidales bacterium]